MEKHPSHRLYELIAEHEGGAHSRVRGDGLRCLLLTHHGTASERLA
jgi:hypothetical protein